jgi:hypothetical protein
MRLTQIMGRSHFRFSNFDFTAYERPAPRKRGGEPGARRSGGGVGGALEAGESHAESADDASGGFAMERPVVGGAVEHFFALEEQVASLVGIGGGDGGEEVASGGADAALDGAVADAACFVLSHAFFGG